MTADERMVKHMEMIQAVIGRLGNDSFLVKGWSVTVAGAFFGFAANSSEWRLALASVPATICFWALDTLLLRSERLFRTLYDHVRRGDERIEPFFMGATSPGFIAGALDDGERRLNSWLGTCRRPTLAAYYGALVLAALAMRVLTGTD